MFNVTKLPSKTIYFVTDSTCWTKLLPD